MKMSREPRPSVAEGEGVKDAVRCSECGTKLMTLKDHIQKEDSFVCASCYQVWFMSIARWAWRSSIRVQTHNPVVSLVQEPSLLRVSLTLSLR